jgi:preprotein translocase subunit SecG
VSNRTFIIVVIVVALFVSALLYLHRPRNGGASHSVNIHGTR